MQRVGLIAGNGRFPLIFARTARAEGVEVVAVAHEGETLPELTGVVDHITWIKVGELGRMIGTFQDAGIDRAVMAGGIRKAALLEHFAPDERGMQFLARLGSLGDDTLLRGVADELEGEGIRIVESTLFLSSLLTPGGPADDAGAGRGAVDGHPPRLRGRQGHRPLGHRPERRGQVGHRAGRRGDRGHRRHDPTRRPAPAPWWSR